MATPAEFENDSWYDIDEESCLRSASENDKENVLSSSLVPEQPEKKRKSRGKKRFNNRKYLECCLKMDPLLVMRSARAKLLWSVIEKSKLSLAAKVMLVSVVDEEYPEEIQAIAEGREPKIAGGAPTAHLLRGILRYEAGDLDGAKSFFGLATSKAGAWFGYSLCGDDSALKRAFDMDPSLPDHIAFFFEKENTKKAAIKKGSLASFTANTHKQQQQSPLKKKATQRRHHVCPDHLKNALAAAS